MARLLLALLVVAALASGSVRCQGTSQLEASRRSRPAATNTTAVNQTLLNETLAAVAARTPANVSLASGFLGESAATGDVCKTLAHTVGLPGWQLTAVHQASCDSGLAGNMRYCQHMHA